MRPSCGIKRLRWKILTFIFSIVGEILKIKKTPEAPTITFIKNVIVTFLNTLPEPPDSWDMQTA